MRATPLLPNRQSHRSRGRVWCAPPCFLILARQRVSSVSGGGFAKRADVYEPKCWHAPASLPAARLPLAKVLMSSAVSREVVHLKHAGSASVRTALPVVCSEDAFGEQAVRRQGPTYGLAGARRGRR
ncbi:hypothetical protein TRVL_09002 [Trypanosoma vivax]|nr:hypothetical protein TRVL_09002 [Trypanosoma vivax]